VRHDDSNCELVHPEYDCCYPYYHDWEPYRRLMALGVALGQRRGLARVGRAVERARQGEDLADDGYWEAS